MKDDKKTLTPKLRFPEFRNGPGWDETSFNSLYAFKPTNTLSRDKLNYDSGTIRNIHYGDIHTRFRTQFDTRRELVPFVTNGLADDFDDEAFCAEGDLVFADASEDLNDVGKSIEVVRLHDERVVSGTHTILATRRDARPVVGFGAYLFRSERIRQQVRKESQGAKVYGISPGRLANVKVCLPATGEEQQKIEACLRSLDEWIDAEERKLRALRTFKKGLTRQLFPREGEARPRLRFPEFRDAPDWDTKTMEQVSTIVRGGSPRPIDAFLTRDPNGLNWLKIGDVDEGSKYVTKTEQKVRPEALSRTRAIKPGEFILSNSMSFGRPYISTIDTCIHDGWIAVTQIDKNVDLEFLYYSLTTERSQSYFADQAAGGGVRNLTTDIVKAMPIPYCAPREQERVAACLSSLDALLDAQFRGLESLRIHRKGLMQQLFPSPEEE